MLELQTDSRNIARNSAVIGSTGLGCFTCLACTTCGFLLRLRPLRFFFGLFRQRA